MCINVYETTTCAELNWYELRTNKSKPLKSMIKEMTFAKMIFGRKQNEWNQPKWNEWLYSEVFMKFAIKIELKLDEHFPRRVNYIKIDHGHREYNHLSYQILAIPIWRKGRVNPLNFIVIFTLIILKFSNCQSSIKRFFLFMSLMKNNKENAIFLESRLSCQK